jgi:hypothetical protein
LLKSDWLAGIIELLSEFVLGFERWDDGIQEAGVLSLDLVNSFLRVGGSLLSSGHLEERLEALQQELILLDIHVLGRYAVLSHVWANDDAETILAQYILIKSISQATANPSSTICVNMGWCFLLFLLASIGMLCFRLLLLGDDLGELIQLDFKVLNDGSSWIAESEFKEDLEHEEETLHLQEVFHLIRILEEFMQVLESIAMLLGLVWHGS